ncbi:MAG: FHA domain-containing protein [Myxococcales bacterium FL481]|nr:MAG: FHA domain-containing protein [Myxococcales bacterium FL481]
MHTAILEIRHPDGRKELREMLQGTLSIGSKVGEILLPDPKVSPSHARLRLQGMALTYTDIGSAAGSFVDGSRLTAPTTLAAGASVVLGQTSIRLRGFGLKRTSKTEVTVKIHRNRFGLPPEGAPTSPPSAVSLRATTGAPASVHVPALLAQISEMPGRRSSPAPTSVEPATSPLNAPVPRFTPPARALDSLTDRPLPPAVPSQPADPAAHDEPLSEDPATGDRQVQPRGTSTAEPIASETAPHDRPHTDLEPAITPVSAADQVAETDAAPTAPEPRDRGRGLEWTLLIGAAAAALGFIAWRGGYLPPIDGLRHQAQSVPHTTPAHANPTPAGTLANTAPEAARGTQRKK